MVPMNSTERDQFAAVIQHIEEIANVAYGGDLDGNFYTIFEDHLNGIQKEIYLKGSRKVCGFLNVGLCPTSKGNYPKVQEIPLKFHPTKSASLNQELTNMHSKDHVKVVKTEEDSKEDIEFHNKKALVELKTWFLKTVVIAVIIGLFLMIGGMVFWDPGDTSTIGKVISGMKVIINGGE